MAANVGGADRAIRMILGLALLALAFLHVFTGGVMILAYVVGAIAIITGVVRYCPAWAIFGINTHATKSVGTPASHAK